MIDHVDVTKTAWRFPPERNRGYLTEVRYAAAISRSPGPAPGRLLVGAMSLLLLSLSTILPAFSQDGGSDGYVVAGTISGISEEGALLISLVDRAGWGADAEELQNPGSFEGYVQGLLIVPEGRRSVSYRFEEVPPGSYAIRAFLDSNGNENLDFGLFGPREPWGMYRDPRPVLGPPRFRAVSFEVDGDVRDADFTLD